MSGKSGVSPGRQQSSPSFRDSPGITLEVILVLTGLN